MNNLHDDNLRRNIEIARRVHERAERWSGILVLAGLILSVATSVTVIWAIIMLVNWLVSK